MEKLLSDKWDNVVLTQALSEALLYFKHEDNNAFIEKNKERDYYNNTPFYLADHRALQAGIIVVKDEFRELVFLSKNFLLNYLENEKIPTVNDLSRTIRNYLQEVYEHISKEDNIVKLTPMEFSNHLKKAQLGHISESFDLERKKSIKDNIYIS